MIRITNLLKFYYVRYRKMTDLQIMDAAIQMGVRAVVTKSHLVPTADRASLLNMIKKEKYGDAVDFTMYGGIALNRAVGDINPWAVEATLKLGAKVIWLPTNMADNHTRKEGRGAGGFKFSDYIKANWSILLISFVICVAMLPSVFKL